MCDDVPPLDNVPDIPPHFIHKTHTMVHNDESDDDSHWVSIEEQKRLFYSHLDTKRSTMGPNTRLLTSGEHARITTYVKRHKNGTLSKELKRAEGTNAYHWPRRYDVLTFGEIDTLVLRQELVSTSSSESPSLPAIDSYKVVSNYDRVFHDIYGVHHDGNDHPKARTLEHRLKDKFALIPRWLGELFTSLCPVCIERVRRKKPTAGHQPILTKGLGVRGQVDLIDFQSMPDGNFKFLLNYQDHGIKFLFSLPLTSKRAAGVAWALLQVFTIVGPPAILQSDNGCEFNNSQIGGGRSVDMNDESIDDVIKELRVLWKECRVVRGSPRHSESNGGIERMNMTIEGKLAAWMKDNNSQRWTVGCSLVQWRINTQVNRTIGNTTPYSLMFGQRPRVGISSLPIESDLLDTLATEAQLNTVLGITADIPLEEAHVTFELDEHNVTQATTKVPDATRKDAGTKEQVTTTDATTKERVATTDATTKEREATKDAGTKERVATTDADTKERERVTTDATTADTNVRVTTDASDTKVRVTTDADTKLATTADTKERVTTDSDTKERVTTHADTKHATTKVRATINDDATINSTTKEGVTSTDATTNDATTKDAATKDVTPVQVTSTNTEKDDDATTLSDARDQIQDDGSAAAISVDHISVSEHTSSVNTSDYETASVMSSGNRMLSVGLRGTRKALVVAMDKEADNKHSTHDNDNDTTATPTKRHYEDIDMSTATKWLGLINKIGDVTQNHLINARLRQCIPVMYQDDDGWRSCICRRVGKLKWEYLSDTGIDLLQEVVANQFVGPISEWGTYVRAATLEEIRVAELAAKEDGLKKADDEMRIAPTPKRMKLRDDAFESQVKAAHSMQKRATKKTGTIDPGTVVQVNLDDVDRSKVGDSNLTLVVLEITKKTGKYRLGCQRGPMKRLYTRSYMTVVPNSTAKLQGLEDVYSNWQGMPTCTEREAARIRCAVGGQGVLKCTCRGSCETDRCTCKKAGRSCNSRCHKGSQKCRNLGE